MLRLPQFVIDSQDAIRWSFINFIIINTLMFFVHLFCPLFIGTVFPLLSAGPQIRAASLGIHIEISASTMKMLLIFRFFHYIWFINSENLCFILILKEKMARFWSFILFISLILKLYKHLTVSKLNKRRGRLLEEIR